MDNWKKGINYDNDNEDDNGDLNHNILETNMYLDDEDDLISSEDEEKILKVLDNDLVEYFSDAKIIKKKFNNFSKKEKKEKIIFEVNEKVEYKGLIYTVLYGPYEVDNKIMYELETPDGNVISLKGKYIKKL